MHYLSAHDVLKIWEANQNKTPLERALAILSAVFPSISKEKLASLTIAQRDILLLNIQEQIFGSILRGYAECPQCKEHLEFTFSTREILSKQENNFFKESYLMKLNDMDIELSFRLPHCNDLALTLECEDIRKARSLIAGRCLLKATRNGMPILETDLSDEVIEKLAECMAECEPQSEILLDLHCPACSHHWQMIFDIVIFLWVEISSYAKRLMLDVHTLASAYKWREADILSMSPYRRQYYLEKVS